jgi:hypothetical protein
MMLYDPATSWHAAIAANRQDGHEAPQRNAQADRRVAVLPLGHHSQPIGSVFPGDVRSNRPRTHHPIGDRPGLCHGTSRVLHPIGQSTPGPSRRTAVAAQSCSPWSRCGCAATGHLLTARGPARACPVDHVTLGSPARCPGMGRGDLTDAEWEQLRPFLPVSNMRCGRWRDHRQVIDGILHRIRTGAHWRATPSNGRSTSSSSSARSPPATTSAATSTSARRRPPRWSSGCALEHAVRPLMRARHRPALRIEDLGVEASVHPDGDNPARAPPR